MALGTVTFEYSKYSDEQILEKATLELDNGVLFEVSRTPGENEVEFRIIDKTNSVEASGYGDTDGIAGFARALSQFRKQMG